MLDRSTPNIFGTSPTFDAEALESDQPTLELEYEPDLLWDADPPRGSSRHFTALRDQLAAGIPSWLSLVRPRRRLWPLAVLLPLVLLLTHHPARRGRSVSAQTTVKSPVQAAPTVVARQTNARAPRPQARRDRPRLPLRRAGVRRHRSARPTARRPVSDAGRLAASPSTPTRVTTFPPASSGPPPQSGPPGRTRDAEFGFER